MSKMGRKALEEQEAFYEVPIAEKRTWLEKHAEWLLKLRMTLTPKNLVKEREGKGGHTFKYITKHEGYKWLDKNYPGLWSFEIKDKFFDRMHYVHGSLTIQDPITGFKRVYEDYGIAELIIKKDGKVLDQMYYKTAASDSFKRCCVQAGAFNDVYSSDEEGFSSMPEIDWKLIFDNIGKGREKFDDDKLGAQLVYLASGVMSEEKLVNAWNAK